MWKIGNVEISNRVVLAPMAGICNNAYRTIVKEMGCGYMVAEMVSDKALMYGSKKTQDMLYMTEEERPIAQQIFGSDKDSFVIAAKYVYEHMRPDIIDINMGCPVPKVAVSAQAGSALLKNPEKVYEIVSAVVDAVPIPVTVKIRSGWDSNSINAVEIARICEKAGAAAITVHPRTRNQGYEGKADWSIIRDVKNSVTIPVIGNGDILSCFDAEKMIRETRCDAVMIGRGVLGNPWLIKECVEYLESHKIPSKRTVSDVINMIEHHLDNLLATKPYKVAVLEMRTHIAWYLKGLHNGKELKQEIFKTTTKEEIMTLLREYEQRELNYEENKD